MSFTFRPATRENLPLLIGLAGGTGSGKTFSAMRIASGIAGERRFAVIDTEAGRAKHYADKFRFDHGDLAPPFAPDRYADAIKSADDANYPVIVVDSASHEHAGEGGILDMHEAELYQMAKDDWKKRESCKMAAWIKPKMQHKAMVNRLLQVRAHVIMCFRAEEKVEVISDRQLLEREFHSPNDDGSPEYKIHADDMLARIEAASRKMKIVPKQSRSGRDGWFPICEKSLPFEMTCSFLLLSDSPGVPLPIKLGEDLRAFFPSGKPIEESTGRALAAWARGAQPLSGEAERAARVKLLECAAAAAEGGMSGLETFWKGLNTAERKQIEPDKQRLKAIASEADARLTVAAGGIGSEPSGPEPPRNRVLEMANDAADGGQDVLAKYLGRLNKDALVLLAPHMDAVNARARAVDAGVN